MAGAAACSHFSPKPSAPVIAMAIPAPPQRELIPVELTDPAPEVLVTTEAPAPPPAPARPREAAARPTPTPATPAASTVPAEAAPPPVIQTTTQTSQAEQKIQAMLAAAEVSLRGVVFRDLSTEARAQYDQAKAFILQAQDNLKARKYAFAELLATKATDILRMLSKG